jgi:DNA gyrase/topoisomerase IV subunit B
MAYSDDEVIISEWHEFIRLRPNMYIGYMDSRGFVNLLKTLCMQIFEKTQSNDVLINIDNNYSGKIRFSNIKKTFSDEYTIMNRKNPFFIELGVLNALSNNFTFKIIDKFDSILTEQVFEKGILIKGEIEHKNYGGFQIDIEFQLDTSIWKNNFQINNEYLIREFRDFAYLFKEVKFEINYKVEEELCRIIYAFKQGLKDKLDVLKLRGYYRTDEDTWFQATFDNFTIEAAFGFNLYWGDITLKSYANGFYMYENGTHVDAFLKGFVKGIKQYFKKNNIKRRKKLSKKTIRDILVAFIHIKMEAAVYGGSSKTYIRNSEIIEPIADYVANLTFQKLETNQEIAEGFIHRFGKIDTPQ